MNKPVTRTLQNGLKVILLENRNAPVVSLNLWANVGSVNETDSEAGICHLIEHMIFKGTTRRPVGQIAKEVEAAGGDMNAYTSFDETVFYINMSSKQMDTGLDVLADAASDPTFDEEELTREKEVVVEEISRAEDNPSQMVGEDLFGRAYTVHPYHRPIAGNRETVRAISRRYLLDFYKRWYVGSNLIFIAVGDFETDAMFEKVEMLFSKIPAGSPPVQNIPAEPAQTEPRTVTRAMNVKGSYVDMAFPIPDFCHEDTASIDFLAHLLGGGASSRLEVSVKEEQQLVNSVSASAYTPRYPGLFFAGAVLKDKPLKAVLQGIWNEIERLRNEPPTAREFARTRDNLRATRVYERQTVEAMARKIGFFEGVAQNLDFEEEYYGRLAKLTPEDVQVTAQKYLRAERMTVSFCHSPSDASWTEEKIRSLLPLKAPAKIASKPMAKAKIHHFKLPSGVRLIVRENHHLPLISLRSASLGGLRGETRRDNGISHLTSLLTTKGSRHRTARETAEQIEGLAGHLDGYTGRNLIGMHASFLAEKMTDGFELFFDLLLEPAFLEEEIRKEKSRTLIAIRNEEDSLAGLAMKKFLSQLYPKHPYGLPMLGTQETLQSIRREQLIRNYAKTIHPGNLVLSVVGDVDPQEIETRIREKLLSWRPKKYPVIRPEKPKPPHEPLASTMIKNKLQAHIVYGFSGTTIYNKDRYALDVLNLVLAGQGGRLFLELRDKQGLAYQVTSFSQEGLEAGYFAVYIGTDPAKLDKALAGIQDELEKVRKSPVPEEEIDRAKKFIIGNYELDLQRNDTVGAILAYNEIYGIPSDDIELLPHRIEKVTQRDIQRVAQQYLRPEASVLAVIRP